MRAKDLLMAATIDPQTRQILITGGIDRNETVIIVSVKVPSPGLWTVIKAEVNMTDQPWQAWEIALGKGCRLPTGASATKNFLSRQFKNVTLFPEREAFLFHGGEVRPGESILKVFRIRVSTNRMFLAHSRIVQRLEPRALKKLGQTSLGEGFARVEVDLPVRITKPEDRKIV